jgi:hypothetical protein
MYLLVIGYWLLVTDTFGREENFQNIAKILPSSSPDTHKQYGRNQTLPYLTLPYLTLPYRIH